MTIAPRPPPGLRSTCGLVAMTLASHAEDRQFDPGQVYTFAAGRRARLPLRSRSGDGGGQVATSPGCERAQRRNLWGAAADFALAFAPPRPPTARGPVAQWIRHRPTEPGIAGSSPAGVIAGGLDRKGACVLGLPQGFEVAGGGRPPFDRGSAAGLARAEREGASCGRGA